MFNGYAERRRLYRAWTSRRASEVAAPAPWAQAVNSRLRSVPTWPVYALGFAWMAWLFWRGLTDCTLIEPIDWLEREYGITSLQLVCATLAVTPLRRFAGLNLLRFRRSIGLLVFAFVLAHLLVWALLDVQALSPSGRTSSSGPT